MNHLCLIIDLEGFFIQQKFVVRELGYTTRRGESGSLFFAPPMAWDQLNPKDQRATAFTTRHIHGLPFMPSPEEQALPQDQLHATLRDLHLRYGTPRHHVVAYKGGQVERDLLRSLHIPRMDLERMGCPKTGNIVKRNIELWGCGHHPAQHCGQADAFAYWTWWRTIYCN